MNPKIGVSMARKKVAKRVPNVLCRTTYDINCIGVRETEIAKRYKTKQPTVSNKIRRLRNAEKSTTKKKTGKNSKLSGRSTRLFRKYIIDNCYEPLYNIVDKFNSTAVAKN